MTISLKHAYTATGTDSGSGEVHKAEWNADHTLTMATARILGRTSASTGSVEELSADTVRGFLDTAVFFSRAALQAATISSNIKRVFVTYYDTTVTAINSGHWMRLSDGTETANYPTQSWVQSADSKYWLLDEFFVTPQMLGVKGHPNDGNYATATDETTGLQAWLNHLSASFDQTTVSYGAQGYLPAGLYYATSLTVSKPTVIIGDGNNSTCLKIIDTTNNSLLKIRIAYTGTDYTVTVPTFAILHLEGFHLRGTNPLGGYTSQNGLDLQNASVNPVNINRIILRNMEISHFCNNNINALNYNGYVDGFGNNIHSAGKANLRADGCHDWRMISSNFFGAAEDGIKLSGSGTMLFTDCNTWDNDFSGVDLYADNINQLWVTFKGGTTDRNGRYGFRVSMTHSYHAIHIIDREFMFNSASADNTYSDIFMDNGTAGNVYCSNVKFGPAFSQAVEARDNVKYHVEYGTSVTGYVFMDGSCNFNGGSLVESSSRVKSVFPGNIDVLRNLNVTNGIALGSNTGSDVNMSLNSTSGTTKSIFFKDAGVNRWEIAKSSSGFGVNAYDVSGVYQSTPISVDTSNYLVTMTGGVRVKNLTVAQANSLGASTVGSGSVVYITNESGGATLAMSDGTNWRRVTDRAVIS